MWGRYTLTRLLKGPIFHFHVYRRKGSETKKFNTSTSGEKKHTFQSLLCHGIPSYHSNLPMTPHQYHDTRDRCGPTGLSVSDPWENSWPPKIRTCCRRSWCQRGAFSRVFSLEARNKEKRRSWDPDPYQNHPTVPRDAMNPWKSLQHGYRNLPANEGTCTLESNQLQQIQYPWSWNGDSPENLKPWISSKKKRTCFGKKKHPWALSEPNVNSTSGFGKGYVIVPRRVN